MYKEKYTEPVNKPQEHPVPVLEEEDFFDFLNDKSMPELAAEELQELSVEDTLDIPLEDPAEVQPEEPPAIPEWKTKRMAASAARKRKRARNSRIFYSIYFAFIVLAICALLLLMTPLHNWLVKFEASQPDTQCQQVYDVLFADPDWGVLYDLAGLEATEFEGKEEFIHYMTVKTANAKNPELTYSETSAGLSGDHKYLVYLDDEKVASFMLNDVTPEGAEYSQWQLGTVELFFTRQQSTTVERLPGYTVLINGVALSDDYTVRTVFTKAEEYLPEGIHGYYREYQYIEGLLVHPATVEVVDVNGETIPLIFDMDNNIYKLDIQETANMTTDEEQIVLNAAKANALYSIRAINAGDLRKYFDPNTQIYKDICNTPTFIQSYNSYAFDESVSSVTDFYRYSEELFCARVTLQLDITRKDGSIKSLEMNTTYFMTQNAVGNYMVTNITNVELQQVIEQVRLSFEVDGTLMETRFADSSAQTIAVPRPVAPDGKVFKGWATQTVGSDGKITRTIVFIPGEGGIAQVPTDLVLEPMTLYAVFETEASAQ